MDKENLIVRTKSVIILEFLLSIAMTFFWPAAVFFPSFDKFIVVLAGLVMITLTAWVVIENNGIIKWNLTPWIAIPFLLLILGLLASINNGPIDYRELGYFIFAIVPPVLVVSMTPARINIRLVAVLASSFVFIQFFGIAKLSTYETLDYQYTINPIVGCHLAWMALLSLMLWKPSFRMQFALVLALSFFALNLLSSGDKLGPLLAFSVALWMLILQLSRANNTSRFIQLINSAPVRVLLFVLAAWFLYKGIFGIIKENSRGNLSQTLIRAQMWLDVLQNGRINGNGLKYYVLYNKGIYTPLAYAHNFVFDTYRIAGLLGVALVLLVTLKSIRSCWMRKDVLFPIYIGIIIANLSSFGIFYCAPFWLAIFSMLVDAKQWEIPSRSELLHS